MLPVYRVGRSLRAVFNEDLQAELGNLTDLTADQLNTTLQTVLEEYDRTIAISSFPDANRTF